MQRTNRMCEPGIFQAGTNRERAGVLNDSVKAIDERMIKKFSFPREKFHLTPHRVFYEAALFSVGLFRAVHKTRTALTVGWLCRNPISSAEILFKLLFDRKGEIVGFYIGIFALHRTAQKN